MLQHYLKILIKTNKKQNFHILIFPIVIIWMLIYLNSCTKPEFTRQIKLTTDSINMEGSTYIASGKIIDLGTGVSKYGHCWSKNPNPEIGDQETYTTSYDYDPDSGLINFKSQVSGLDIGETYYIRSYATGNEIEYGNAISFNYKYYTIKTDTVIIVNSGLAIAKGFLQILGDFNIQNYGHCWSNVNETPTIDDYYSSKGETSQSDSVITDLTDLELGEEYYIRSYLIENYEITYSDIYQFLFGSTLFWNTLESEQAIMNSKIGPDIQLINYIINDWDSARIEEGENITGLYINQDTLEGWQDEDTGANFFAIDISETELKVEQGAIEFWFEFKYDSEVNNYAYFFDMANDTAEHFDNALYHSNAWITAGWNGWKFFEKEENFFFTFGIEQDNKTITIETADLDTIPGTNLIFSEGTLMHFAFVWNVNGIEKSSETLRIYINGEKCAESTQKWRAIGDFDPYLYLGSVPGYDNRNSQFNAVKGIMKDFKIYNYSKTNFNN